MIDVIVIKLLFTKRMCSAYILYIVFILFYLHYVVCNTAHMRCKLVRRLDFVAITWWLWFCSLHTMSPLAVQHFAVTATVVGKGEKENGRGNCDCSIHIFILSTRIYKKFISYIYIFMKINVIIISITAVCSCYRTMLCCFHMPMPMIHGTAHG